MRRIYITVLIPVFFFSCVSSGQYKELEEHFILANEELEELTAQNQDLLQQIEAVEASAREAEEELESVQAELAEKNAELEQLREQRNELGGEAQQAVARIQELEARIQELEGSISELQARNEQLTAELEQARTESDREDVPTEAAVRTHSEISAAFRSELASGDMQLRAIHNEVRLIIDDQLFFNSGSAEVRGNGANFLRRLAAALKNNPDSNVQIEGHTDDRAIGGRLARRYPSNWDLGAARAVNVARYLQENEGIEPGRLRAVSYGQYKPVGDNRTEAGRAQNRRIEISIIVSDEAEPTTLDELEADNGDQSSADDDS